MYIQLSINKFKFELFGTIINIIVLMALRLTGVIRTSYNTYGLHNNNNEAKGKFN